MSCPSPFANIPEPRLETLNALQALFANDPAPEKANLMIGVYRDDRGNPVLLNSVKRARRILYDNPSWTHEYPSSHLGECGYRDLSTALFFSSDSHLIKKKRRKTQYYMLTWTKANHANVFHHVGLETESLPWFSNKTRSLDIEALVARIASLPSGSVIVLQTAGNNPTGCDPTPSDWRRLAEWFIAGNHLVFFDAAYPGFVSGDFERDCEPVRSFAEAGVPMLLASTYGKAFGLYGERVGMLFATTDSAEHTRRVEGHMKLLARAETGAQPSFGASLVQAILGNADLRRIWEQDLMRMATELQSRRHILLEKLYKLDSKKDWSFIKHQAGMFTYTGLDAKQIDRLKNEHHVYLQDTGRLSIAGLNSTNIDHVAKSLHAVT
ncbi:hypothetical protein FHL15_009926 [Xylaria flabelliformis]|uniref:Aminotransferase class I/classII large domain-containing protein n=1 Tax=Xylaria flabelliformis TaxID=2512241 RepID=A0A553HMP8_9PEZI|nr:hypothetical protein FHL15_009926 [Xylaria flabelliformis]